MAKMREVGSKKTAKQSKVDYELVPVEMNGQTIMMKVLKPVAAPKVVTARCQG